MRAQVSNCGVLLALVGPHWLAAKDKEGARRLHGARDYVRVEIASALKRDSLARRHALELRHTRFAADADAIVSALKAYLPPPKKRWIWSVAVACLVGAASLGAALYFKPGFKPLESSVTEPPATALAPPKEVAAACPSTRNYGPPPTAETELTRVNCFTFFSLSGDRDPGLRIWEREVDGTWTETYPSGFSEKGIEERERENVSGCRGSIVGPADEQARSRPTPKRIFGFRSCGTRRWRSGARIAGSNVVLVRLRRLNCFAGTSAGKEATN